jgi:hypothetical protein
MARVRSRTPRETGFGIPALRLAEAGQITVVQPEVAEGFEFQHIDQGTSKQVPFTLRQAQGERPRS